MTALLFQLSRHFDVTGRSVGLDGVSQSKEPIERANPSSWFFFKEVIMAFSDGETLACAGHRIIQHEKHWRPKGSWRATAIIVSPANFPR
jgi:hypothetical protein